MGFCKIKKTNEQRKIKMNYNLILYIGTALIVSGFLLFLFCEMKEREIDRKLAENQRFIDALLRTQQLQNIRKDIKKI